MKLEARCRAIELVLSDVDGVLTDGGVLFDNQGIESKRFHIRDGMGINLWRRAGFEFGLVTARNSHLVKVRAAELGVELVRQGVDDKRAATEAILKERNLNWGQVCYLGDDLADLPVMRSAGLAVAVADGVEEVRHMAHWVSQQPGGHGAVRETIEMILKEKQLWSEVIKPYISGS
jgi:YrbI family 3-deoxy-D-manno-octulosonate 8-phosphate phosphatase